MPENIINEEKKKILIFKINPKEILCIYFYQKQDEGYKLLTDSKSPEMTVHLRDGNANVNIRRKDRRAAGPTKNSPSCYTVISEAMERQC